MENENKDYYEYDENGNVTYSKIHEVIESWGEYDKFGNLIHYKSSTGTEYFIDRDEVGNMICFRSIDQNLVLPITNNIHIDPDIYTPDDNPDSKEKEASLFKRIKDKIVDTYEVDKVFISILLFVSGIILFTVTYFSIIM